MIVSEGEGLLKYLNILCYCLPGRLSLFYKEVSESSETYSRRSRRSLCEDSKPLHDRNLNLRPPIMGYLRTKTKCGEREISDYPFAAVTGTRVDVG